VTDLSSSGVLLPGIGMGGYRSLFGLQSLGPLRKVTLIAGQNNTGKSNILRFASLLLAQPVPQFQWADEPQPPGPPLQLQMAFPALTQESFERLNIPDPASFISVFDSEVFHPTDGDTVWLTYSCEGANAGNRHWVLEEQFLIDATTQASEGGLRPVVSRASSALTGTAGGPEGEDMRRVLERIFPFAPPAVETVGAFRQIVEASPAEVATPSVDDFSGRDLVRRLARLANPSAERYAVDRARFDAINQFAQTVLEDRNVEIRIAADQNEIQVHQGSRVFPLSSLGTGIHQVIILATAATLLENTLVCIEEPEVFLHPVLQRKLVRYLSEVTTNQYLIATHSAHMLDYERACVLHVTHDPGLGTTVTRAQSLQAVADLCGDLGYRPSDLIQANAVIWVEGPSDRVYMKHWLQMVAGDEFIEGIHYSVMFYGGSLLRYLTADDPSVADFISLRRLNRHSAILIDSDKKNSRARLGETKVRVMNEFAREDMPGFAWVTDGRTIESYVPVETLAEAVGAIHRRSSFEPPADKWADPLQIVNKEGMKVQADKVKIARDACERWPEGQLTAHLRERVSEVVDFIRTANGSVGRLPHEPTRQ
jgi:predicted ATPase